MNRKIIAIGLLLTLLLCCGACSPSGETEPSELSSAVSELAIPRIESISDLPRGKAPAGAGLAAVQAEPEGLWGYLAADGTWAVEPAFFGAADFSEGLASVKTEGEYHEYVYGYIDRTGSYSEALHPWFTDAGAFSCGLARVTDNHSDYFYIDRSGELAFPERIFSYDEGAYYEAFVNAFNFATDFCGGYALVAEENPCDGGYDFAVISEKGECVLQLDPKYCEGEMHAVAGSAPDENGYCIVGAETAGETLYGVINLKGESVLPLEYEEIYPFSDGCFAARKEGLWGFVDAEGAEILPFRYEGARSFSGGAAPVMTGGKWGLVDRKGDWLREPEFEAVSPEGFSGGLLAVSAEEKWGFIDARGVEIVPAVLASAGDFSEGLAWFSDAAGSYGFLSEKGEVVIEPQFCAVSDFCSADAPAEAAE